MMYAAELGNVLLLFLAVIFNAPSGDGADVAVWLTKADESVLFQKQNVNLNFQSGSNNHSTITVDETQTFQTMDGYGNALTGASAILINSLNAIDQDRLLKELFNTDGSNLGVSYLRISIGASDLSDQPFTYDDMPAGQTDPSLARFSIRHEQQDLIPVLKRILVLNPTIKILGSPWSAPPWMKTNGGYKGGSLKHENYPVYAMYFVKYIQAMKAAGITIDAITPQNEPLYGGNNPSMTMSSSEQADFIKNHLGPAFRTAGITTKIIIYDHNCDNPYPIQVLDDAQARQYIDGSAFHLYGGQITSMTQVHNTFPDKNIYFTEKSVHAPSHFGRDLAWAVKNLIIGAPRNWAKNVLQWNMASDPNYKPNTGNGACVVCLGAITINNGHVISRNVPYYILAHGSKFVRPGSVRIGSNVSNGLENVAFKTSTGSKVLIVLNDGSGSQTFNIKYNGKMVTTELDKGAVATYIW